MKNPGNNALITVKPRISPHKFAPLFSGPDAEEIMMQLISEVSGGNFPTESNNFRLAFAQLGFVNLWAFLRLIASFSGPYEKLTGHLHMEMANFYQDSMYPGSKAACFIGRSNYKSSVFTHGGNTWEILRNPELHIGLGCGIEKRALEFLHYSQDTITDNELFAWLYGQKTPSGTPIDPWGCYVPEGQTRGWNDTALTLPNKMRNKRKPNIIPLTAGGSTAGIHVDLLKLDDVISDKDLDSERNSSASMRQMGNWLKSSIRTLVMDWKESRVFLSGTRYAPDDAYEPLMKNCRKQVGYWDELRDQYKEESDGEWDIYYRMIRENGRIIFPEAFTEEGLQKLEEEDPWTYWTQYVNNPFMTTTTELSSYKIKLCSLDYREGPGYVIVYMEGPEQHEVLLSSCDVIQVTDPAASETKMSAKTSRTAHVIFATAPDGKMFIIKGHAGYVAVSEMFQWMFDGMLGFQRYLRLTGLEMKGAFKLLHPLLREEQQRRRIGLNLRPIATQGDKDPRIRSFLEPALRKGLLFSVESFAKEVNNELRVFPDGPRKDVLDAVAMAIQEAIKPPTEAELMAAEEEELLASVQVNKVTGY